MDLDVCGICGDRLGVYEPTVVVDQDGSRVTSQAAEPDLLRRESARYHRGCFERSPPANIETPVLETARTRPR